MPEMRHVYSSHVASIGYDPDSSELHVTYQNGKTSVYESVPPGKADQVMSAPSIGEALHRFIRGQHEHRYL